MALDQLGLLDEELKLKIWFRGAEAGLRVTGVTLKCEPTGVLVIVKAISAEGPVITFRGCKGLGQVRAELAGLDSIPSGKWRPDNFALAQNSTKL